MSVEFWVVATCWWVIGAVSGIAMRYVNGHDITVTDLFVCSIFGVFMPVMVAALFMAVFSNLAWTNKILIPRRKE